MARLFLLFIGLFNLCVSQSICTDSFGQGFTSTAGLKQKYSSRSNRPKVTLDYQQIKDSLQKSSEHGKNLYIFLSNGIPNIQNSSDFIKYSRIISFGDMTEHVKFKKEDASINSRYSPGIGLGYSTSNNIDVGIGWKWSFSAEIVYENLNYFIKVPDTTTIIQVFQPNIYYDTCINCIDSKFIDRFILFGSTLGLLKEHNRSTYGLNIGMSIGNLISETEIVKINSRRYETIYDKFSSNRWSFFLIAETFIAKPLSENAFLFFAPGIKFGLTDISSDYAGSSKTFNSYHIKIGCFLKLK